MTRRSKGRRWFAAAAAGIVIGVLAWFSFRNHHDTNQFVDLLIADFEHFQEKGKPLQIASSDRREVSDWLADQTALLVKLPAVESWDGQLLGARKCKIDGKPAAFAVYNVGGSLASLVIMPGTHPDIDSMERVEHEGHTHWVDRCKGHTVLACQRGALVYAAVSTLPEERLFPLMANAER